MTGAYIRINRDDKFQPIEVEHLTDEEREAIFLSKDSEELVRWLNLVCNCLSYLEDTKA